MNTNSELEILVQGFLEDRVAAPPRPDLLRDALAETAATPQARRRSLGRWLHRGGDARRGIDAHDHPPEQDRRTRFMFSATGITAAFAILALAVNALDPAPVPPSAGSGTTHVVAAAGGGDFASIGEAVEAAADGDTISIRPGTYAESVTVDKDLTIAGDGPREDIVITVDEGPIMQLTDSDAVLTGLTFTGPASDGVLVSGGSPILEGLLFREVGVPYDRVCAMPCESLGVMNGSTATVRDSVFVGGGALSADRGAAPLFEGNELTDGPHIPLFDIGEGTIVRDNTISGTVDRAIGLFGPTTALIEGNTIVDPGTNGIDIGWQTAPGVDPVIRDNSISGASRAIMVAQGAMPTIEGNRLSGNDYGISASSGSVASVVGNQFTDNAVGLDLLTSDALVGGNTFSGGRTGILLVGGSPSLRDNSIESAEQGLILAGTTAPSLSGNTVCGNQANLVVREEAETPELAGNEICEDAPAA